MRRGTIFVGLFIIVALAIVGGGMFLDSRPPLKITIVVDPLAQGWLQEAVTTFNKSGVRINNETVLVEIVPFSASSTTGSTGNSTTATSASNTQQAAQINLPGMDDLDVWHNNANLNWTVANHPDIWIPASSVSVGYASSLPFTIIEPSVAWTPLIFGANPVIYDALTMDGTMPLEWQQIVSAAEDNQINIAFPLPNKTISGLSVLYAAAAELGGSPTINVSFLHRDFQQQFDAVIDSVPNFNNMGSDAANYMARFPSAVDLGIAPESQWLMALSTITNRDTIQFGYPSAYPFTFDFPIALWDDDNTSDNERKAVEAFRNWLLNDTQQTLATNYGLRPVTLPVTNNLFIAAQSFGIQPLFTITSSIETPALVDTRTLLSWFERTR